jgi:hypothetical protein
MMKATVTSYQSTAFQFAVDAAWDGIRRAAHFFWDACQTALNTPNTGSTKTRTRNTKAGKKGSTYTVYLNPSQRGEAPHKITGFGAGSVIEQYDKANLVAQVGLLARTKVIKGKTVNSHYMAILELRKNRPWLKKTLDNTMAQLRALAGG